MKVLQDKKIVMLLGSDFSHDSRVLKEALSASRAGMQVTVLARKSYDTKFKELKNKITIIRFQTWIDWVWVKISYNQGREVAGSQSAGTNLPNIIITYASIVNAWFLNRLFARAAVKIQPDLVHANDSITLPASFKLKKKGFKIIYDAHEFYSESVANPYPLWKKYYIYLESQLDRVDGIFSVCQSILDELDQRYKTDHIPKAILYNAPLWQKCRPKKINKPVKILYLGNFQQSLDFSNLFKAVEKIDNLTLTMIGPGWKKVCQGNIKCLGPVKPEEVISTAANYDIGVISYIGDNLNNIYSTPNKLFEYMMAGLAVAGSNFSEIKKIVHQCQNGVLFDSRKATDIRRAINLLISDANTLKQYKKNSLKFAKIYSWGNQEKKQLELYEKIIKES